MNAELLAERTEIWYECYSTPYSRVTFTLLLRRKPLYYVINLILPCSLFSVLTAITFILQPGCSERLGLGQYIHSRCGLLKTVLKCILSY